VTRKKQTPTGVGEILNTLKRTSELGEKFEQARIWEHWEKIAGKHISAHAQPKTVRDGTLVIEVDSSVWMHRITFRKWSIIGRVNRIARKELVSDIFLELAPDEEPTPTKQ